MAAVDVIITLAIIIKIIDIFVMSHKKKNKNKNRTKEPNTTSSNKVPVLAFIVIILIGLAATHQKETPEAKQQVIANNQWTPQANHPAGIYMQPLVGTVTGVIDNMGKKMTENTKRVQQEANQKAKTQSR